MIPMSGTKGPPVFKISHMHVAADAHNRSFAAHCVGSWNALPDRVVFKGSLRSVKKMLANALGDALFEYPMKLVQTRWDQMEMHLTPDPDSNIDGSGKQHVFSMWVPYSLPHPFPNICKRDRESEQVS